MASRFTRVLAASSVLLTILAIAMTTPGAQKSENWVTRSDENALLLFDVQARFNPEFAGRFGIRGLDENIFQLPLDINERNIRALSRSARPGAYPRVSSTTHHRSARADPPGQRT
ncbi:MAG: hypothetical protein O7D32_09345 [bacterium]|nr:hypothetical protein [bacterium]